MELKVKLEERQNITTELFIRMLEDLQDDEVLYYEFEKNDSGVIVPTYNFQYVDFYSGVKKPIVYDNIDYVKSEIQSWGTIGKVEIVKRHNVEIRF
ncbi:MAG: hypothetical protein ACOCZ5_03065 [bacterium]